MLLQSIEIYLAGKFDLPSKEVVTDIARQAGAKVMPYFSVRTYMPSELSLVVVSPEWLASKLDEMRHCHPINVSWLFDSIAAAKVLPLDKYWLCEDGGLKRGVPSNSE
jgi:hypothetical protein